MSSTAYITYAQPIGQMSTSSSHEKEKKGKECVLENRENRSS